MTRACTNWARTLKRIKIRVIVGAVSHPALTAFKHAPIHLTHPTPLILFMQCIFVHIQAKCCEWIGLILGFAPLLIDGRLFHIVIVFSCFERMSSLCTLISTRLFPTDRTKRCKQAGQLFWSNDIKSRSSTLIEYWINFPLSWLPYLFGPGTLATLSNLRSLWHFGHVFDESCDYS